jgi:hypothetical protein
LVIFIILLSGCGRSANSITAEPPSETIKLLFEKAADTLKDYTSEEPLYILDKDFNNMAFEESAEGVHKSYECKIISNCTYIKTLLKYQQAVDHYSEIFTGEALDSFLSKYFYDVDGDLYVNSAGGMSGFGIENIRIAYINQSNGEYFYQVKYDHTTWFENYPSKCHFSVKNIDGNYKISDIDYLSGFITDYPYASK